MKKIGITFYLFFLFVASLTAQKDIEARLVFKENVDFQFTDEWQYLTTDIYLFNGSKFNNVINQVIETKRWRKDNEIQTLFISATIKDVNLTGTKKDIVYPLYNFQIKEEKNKELKTSASDNMEVIRVIDKLPLSSSVNYIDATIDIETVTRNLKKELFNMAADQLLNVSTIENPTEAILSLVGEIGKFIVSNTQNTDYKFSSTIRLYEDHNFDMKLHSMRVYVFIPSNTRSVYFNTKKMSKFVKSSPESHLDRTQIEDLINHSQYPYLVVVNYKSLYSLDVITGDEINLEIIEKRNVKVENAKNLGLIKDEPYRQEKYFIEFLEVFNQLKNSLNLYKLNYEIRNTDAITINLFTIIQDFGNLKRTYQQRLTRFKDNPTFQKLFKSEYESIYGNAELYLEKDANLKNCKEIVDLLWDLRGKKVHNFSPDQMETYLRVLHSIKLPDSEFLSKSVEGQTLMKWIDNIENRLFSQIYQAQINRLKTTPANPETIELRNELRNKVKATNCKLCRNKAIDAISDYNHRYEEYKISLLVDKKDSLIHAAGNKIFDFFIKKDCINKGLEDKEMSASIGSGKEFLRIKHDELVTKLDKLEKLISEQPRFKKESEINDYMNRIQTLLDELSEGYKNICKRYNELCNCE